MTQDAGGEARRGRRGATGLVIVNTGNGKGKTTAALGVLLRAWGRGMDVRMFQFIKNTGSRYGEQRAAEKIGLSISALGDGFTWLSKDLDHSGELAAEQWAHCKEAILHGGHDVVVMDELTYALHFGWVSTDELIDTLKQRPARCTSSSRAATRRRRSSSTRTSSRRCGRSSTPSRRRGSRHSRGLSFSYGGVAALPGRCSCFDFPQHERGRFGGLNANGGQPRGLPLRR